MTTTILEARDLPPGTVPVSFFEPRPFSLDRLMPFLSRWVRGIHL